MRDDALFVLAVLATSLLLFVTERVALEVVALLVVLALMLGGVLSPGDALAGFSDPLVVTIGALFVVGVAVQQTGLGAAMGERLARVAGHDEARLIAATMLASAVLSAFMSTTGTVAILMPVIVGVGRRAGVAPSRLLIPLAFGGHFGSMLTLVATPPNLVASNQLVAHGLPPLGFFSITPIGVALLATGIAYMVFVGRRLLPVSAQSAATRAAVGPAHGGDDDDASRHLAGQLARVRVPAGAPVIGRTIADAAPRSRSGVTIIAVARDEAQLASAGPDTVLRAGDVLVVHGPPPAVAQVVAAMGLESAPPPEDEVDPAAQGEDLGTVEALLPPRSSFLGRTLADVRLRERTGVTALTILRQGALVKDDLAHTRLDMGDVLVLHGPWSRLALLREDAHDLVVLGPLAPRRRPLRRAIVTAVVVLAMVALMASGHLPVVGAALLAAVAVVVSGCVSLEDAYRGVSWSALILIAGMLPMATALERTGAVPVVVEALTGLLGPLGPTATLAGLFLITNVLGQVMSNTATAVLMAPVAYNVAVSLGASPRTLLVAVAIASSMSFSTPVASPVNTLVLAPGGYRFRDFVRVGAPLQLVAFVVTVALLSWAPP
jgi:di/tricarboxylate transporter